MQFPLFLWLFLYSRYPLIAPARLKLLAVKVRARPFIQSSSFFGWRGPRIRYWSMRLSLWLCCYGQWRLSFRNGATTPHQSLISPSPAEDPTNSFTTSDLRVCSRASRNMFPFSDEAASHAFTSVAVSCYISFFRVAALSDLCSLYCFFNFCCFRHLFKKSISLRSHINYCLFLALLNHGSCRSAGIRRPFGSLHSLCGVLDIVPGDRSRVLEFDSQRYINFLRSNISRTGSTEPREDKWGTIWKI